MKRNEARTLFYRSRNLPYFMGVPYSMEVPYSMRVSLIVSEDESVCIANILPRSSTRGTVSSTESYLSLPSCLNAFFTGTHLPFCASAINSNCCSAWVQEPADLQECTQQLFCMGA